MSVWLLFRQALCLRCVFRCDRLLLMIALQTWRRNDSENWLLYYESIITTSSTIHSSIQYTNSKKNARGETLDSCHSFLVQFSSCHFNPTCVSCSLSDNKQISFDLCSICDDFVREKKKLIVSFSCPLLSFSFLLLLSFCCNLKYYLCISSKHCKKRRRRRRNIRRQDIL